MRLLLVTDAWHPQQNGVVRVIGTLITTLKAMRHDIHLISPDGFVTLPCPTYPDIRLAVAAGRKVARRIDEIQPEAIHIATEGPLGLAARMHCLKRRLPFTTAYHTHFPHYVHQRFGLPPSWLFSLVRRFHAPSSGVLAPSPSIYRELRERGFGNVRSWTHGVDTATFRPQDKSRIDLPRPIHMYVGRVAVEKNLPAFLDLDLPGSQVVVGSGPAREALIKRYPKAHFLIAHGDEDLARHYAAADVFVFPSRTDTFGLVMIEALASGVPVAAFPVTGPLDVIGTSAAGRLSENLGLACREALKIPPAICREHALRFSWQETAAQFLGHLHPIAA
jgi:glycosyltransferase involved in cell wall biosynthesis